MMTMGLQFQIFSANIKYGHLVIYQWVVQVGTKKKINISTDSSTLQFLFDFSQRGGRIAFAVDIERVGSFTNS
jgi:hypothetical protein